MTLLDTATVTVALTPADLLIARAGGVWRQEQNDAAGLHNAHGLEAEGYDAHIIGARAEVAVAKYLGRYWSPGERGAGDVGAYQVRYSSKPNGALILHPGDDDHAPYILVVGKRPRYTLVGWCYGWAGKSQRYWSDPTGQNRPAFFVPVRDLSPMSDLPAL